MKRRISTSTLLGNWKNCGTWRWWLYQLWLVLFTVTKGLLKRLEELEIGGRVETIQTSTLLRSAKILRRVLENWGDLLSLKLHWKTRRRRRKTNTAVEYEGDGDINCSWCTWNGPEKFGKKPGGNWKSEEESRLSIQRHCWD